MNLNLERIELREIELPLKSPFETSFEYIRTNADADPYGNVFINRLQNGNAGNASIAFSDLDEDLWSGGVDVNYLVLPDLSVTVGGFYSDTSRVSSRREFLFLAPSNFPAAVGTFRPDLDGAGGSGMRHGLPRWRAGLAVGAARAPCGGSGARSSTTLPAQRPAP